jgi:glycosyltransferase involved in cell wall biosynthesis
MSSSMAKVSVVMTVYNCEQHVEEALQSALAQTYKDFEVIVVDDGSTDRSARIVERFGNAVRYCYQENGGAARATNKGVSLASGEYIAFLENDDAWMPDKLEKQVMVLDHNPGIGAVNNDLRFFSETSEWQPDMIKGYCPDDPYSRIFLSGFNFMLSALVLRRTIFEAAGEFDEGFKAAGLQDVEWYARLMQVAHVHYLPEPLTLFRRHGVRIAPDVMMDNERHLLDCLWNRFHHDSQKARYLRSRRVAHLSDRGQRRIEKGRVAEGRRDLVESIALATTHRTAGKMLLRSLLRLVRSYARPPERTLKAAAL